MLSQAQLLATRAAIILLPHLSLETLAPFTSGMALRLFGFRTFPLQERATLFRLQWEQTFSSLLQTTLAILLQCIDSTAMAACFLCFTNRCRHGEQPMQSCSSLTMTFIWASCALTAKIPHLPATTTTTTTITTTIITTALVTETKYGSSTD